MKECKNCEHKMVCGHIGEVCSHWNGWINVDDEMPEEGEYVECLVYGSDVIHVEDGETIEEAVKRTQGYVSVMMGYLAAEEGITYWCYEGFPMIVQPSYWKRLPEAPEGEL